MSDFNTIPARPLSEKPEEEPEKKEEKKPAIEVEDWGNEPPAPEPGFFNANDDATRISESVKPVEEAPVKEEKPVQMTDENAQSAKTMAFEQITPVEPDQPVNESAMSEPELVEPVYHIPEPPKSPEPEVLDTPVYKPSGGTTPPSSGEPEKKSKVWLIVLIVLLVLCFCCILVIVIAALTGLFSADSLDFTLLPTVFSV